MKLAKQGGYFSYVAGTAAVMLRRCTFSGGLVIHNTSTTLPAQKVLLLAKVTYFIPWDRV